MPQDHEPELVPEMKQGHYSDGHPLDEVHYLECKITSKPDRFTSKKGFFDFAKLVSHAAEKADIDLSTAHLEGQRPQIREVVFLDTADFRLYNHAFILRRRILYEDGFPVGDPEIVFKFRHPDMQKTADLDVRPHIPGVYKIKFKAEALPLKDTTGGMRVLYSHNAEFGLSQIEQRPTAPPWQPTCASSRAWRRSTSTTDDTARAREPDHRRGGALRSRQARFRQGDRRQERT